MKKSYVLEMLPYPSGKLHPGHIRNYTLGDIYARFKKANGFDVLHPMGFDAFGLPAENAAIQNKLSPKVWTDKNIAEMSAQLKKMHFSYDYSNLLNTSSVDYYKHEQRIFIDFFKKGLAYQKESFVNWDPVEQTVLANEQVVDGRGWRSNALIEKKKIKQWFLKITDYAEELLYDLNSLTQWPEKVKSQQREWIGKSSGVEITFETTFSKSLKIFTTRPEAIFGATFIGISLEHDLVNEIRFNFNIKEFCDHLDTMPKPELAKNKYGIFTGKYAIHPFTQKSIPIWICSFVLSDHGHGAIFGCPAHDKRDLEFAEKYNLDVTPVFFVDALFEQQAAYDGIEPVSPEVLINSDFLNGLSISEAKSTVIQKLKDLHVGKEVTLYKLKDWGVSRQRYWGCPIPIIHCATCGPVPNENLPVELPFINSFDLNNLGLANFENWKHTTCPNCGSYAEKETDTLDTFFESSWYFLRYCSPHSDQPFDFDLVHKWMPVDHYIGGIEHAVMHLLYARFFTKALRDIGYLKFSEPFTRLTTQGMVLHALYTTTSGEFVYPNEVFERDGKLFRKNNGEEIFKGDVIKMSKSKKNTVDIDDMLIAYGIDAIKIFSVSDTNPENEIEWSTDALNGAKRFVQRIVKTKEQVKKTPASKSILQTAHITIRKVSEAIEEMRINNAISLIRELHNEFLKSEMSEEIFIIICKLLHPFMPTTIETLYSNVDTWPVYIEKYAMLENINIAIQINGKLRGVLLMKNHASLQDVLQAAVSDDNIAKFINGRKIVDTIFVPNRILNIVC